jgi:hypothetical protein
MSAEELAEELAEEIRAWAGISQGARHFQLSN